MKAFSPNLSIAASRKSAAIFCSSSLRRSAESPLRRIPARLCSRDLVVISLLGVGLVVGPTSAQAAPTDAELDQAFAAAATYQVDQPREALVRIAQAARETRSGDPQRARLEQRMIVFLQSGATLEAKRLICRELWIIGTDALLPALEKMLRDSNTVSMACFALMNYPSKAADAALRRVLEGSTGQAQFEIIDTLANRRDPGSVAPLTMLSAEADGEVALRALDALGRIDTPDAAKALRTSATSPDPVRGAAAKFALLQCAQRLEQDRHTSDSIAIYRHLLADQSEQSVRLQCGAIIGLVSSGASQARAAIKEAMNNPNPLVRATAIAQIPKLKTRSVTAFVKALDTEPPVVQALLIPALAARGEVAARPSIGALASSPNTDVSLAALQALGSIGIARQVPILVAALNHPTLPQNAAAALASLRQMKGNDVDAVIVAALAEAPIPVKADLMDVLVSRNARSALSAMMTYTHSPDPKLYPAAFNAVSRLGDAAQFAPLVTALATLPNRAAEEDAERSVTQFAGRLGESAKASEVVLAEYSRATTPAVRCSLLRVLGETGGARALDVVLAATKDSNDPVRDTAVRTLANWPETSAAGPTLALARGIERPVYQVLLLRGYLRMLALPSQRTSEQTLQAYADGLSLAKRPDEKRLVLAGLAASPVLGSLKLAAPMLDEPAIQSEAALAVVQIVKAHPTADRDLAKAALQKIEASSADAKLKKEAAALLGQIR